MSWNEPGGGNKRPNDPWGGSNQGPPDLDEVLKKVQDKINGLFGGKSSGGGSTPSKGVSSAFIGILVVVAALIWGVMGFYQIDEQERGVVLRFGEYHGTVTPGLQWNPPLIDDVTKVNVTKVRALSFREVMLTKDENIVDVNLSVQYVINNPEHFVLKVRDPEVSLQHATQSALRHVVGDNRMDLVLTEGRAAVAIEVRSRVQALVDEYEAGIVVSQVTVDNAQPPTQVQAAFDDVIKAREDEERVKNEAQAYANGIIPEARGQAQRRLEDANAFSAQVVANAQGEANRFTKVLAEYQKSPVVTRERLYLDAVQAVYSASSKVMVDVEGGNNMMYLPLDKLTERSSGGNINIGGAGSTVDSRTLRQITDAVTEQLRRDAASSRSTTSRGGR